MLDNIREIEKRVKDYLAQGIIETKQKAEFVDFFLKHGQGVA
jgi:hypothetical protein